jgi:hypothetical protein
MVTKSKAKKATLELQLTRIKQVSVSSVNAMLIMSYLPNALPTVAYVRHALP